MQLEKLSNTAASQTPMTPSCLRCSVSPVTTLPQENDDSIPQSVNKLNNAPIIGLPQDGGVAQPREIRLRNAHVGWDFDIHNDPHGGKFDSTAILKS